MIWTIKPELEALNDISKNTAVEYLGIKVIEVGDEHIKATMSVNHKTVQPFRLLHGGISCVLAETLGSVASTMIIDLTKKRAVGLEINANHLRSVKEGGVVTGTVRPIKIGRTVHVWNIEIHDQDNKLCCVSRLTISIINAR